MSAEQLPEKEGTVVQRGGCFLGNCLDGVEETSFFERRDDATTRRRRVSRGLMRVRKESDTSTLIDRYNLSALVKYGVHFVKFVFQDFGAGCGACWMAIGRAKQASASGPHPAQPLPPLE